MPNSVAVLIDADNVPASFCNHVINESQKHGDIIVKRAYGDFTRGNAKSWVTCLSENNILAQLNVAVGSGKNAADISMTIDAMELLTANNVGIFCLASSDSDFTPLATRLREQGKRVFGFGEEKASGRFRNACDNFTILVKSASIQPSFKKNQPQPSLNLSGFDAILRALKDIQVNENWVTLSPLGKHIKSKFPEVKYSKLGGRTLKQVTIKMAEKKMIKTCNTTKGFSVRIF